MVRVCLIICVWFFLPIKSYASELELQLQKNSIEWGQVISARLLAFDTDADLADIDLTPLYEDFAVKLGDLSSGSPKGKMQKLDLDLFPRRTGNLMLPSVTLGDLHSAAQTITVSDALEQGSALVVDLKVSAEQVWQRQQALATVEIKSPERFFNVEIEPFNAHGIEVRPFVLAREPIDGDARYRSRIQLGWAIFPLLGGDFQLELPMIRYLQGGRVKRRFYLPRLNLKVQELPAYIPPNMPVAKVAVESSIANEGLLHTGDIAYWDITLRANGTLTYWLPPVLHGVQSTDAIEFLPAKSTPKLQIDARD
ncbi:MAG: hypothetical protein AMJ53_12090, partial [Gammaproteobacteria bacterium SG8_11]